MPSLPPVFVEIKGIMGDLHAKLGEAGSEIEGFAKKGGGSFDKLAAVGKAAAAGIAGAAIAVGTYAVKAADDYDAAHAKLATAVTNSHQSLADFAGGLKTTDSSMEKFGYTNAVTEEALSHLVTGTGNTGKAMNLMGLAADIAKARNLSLADAADLVTKASEGNTRALKAMGIDLPIATTNAVKLQAAQAALGKATAAATAFLKAHPDAVNAASKAHAAYQKLLATETTDQGKLNDAQTAGGQIIDALSQKFGGQAAASTGTLAAKMQALHAQVTDLAAQLGEKLIPVLTKLAGVAVTVVTWLEKHKAVAIALAAVIGGALVAALGAWAISMGTAAAATIAAAAPVLAIIAAVALVVAGIVELWTHWNQVWNWMKNHPAIAAIIAILAGPIIVSIVAIVAAVHYLYEHWSTIWPQIQHAAEAVANFMKNTVWPAIQTVIAFIMKEVDKLKVWWNSHWTEIHEILNVAWKIISTIVQVAVAYVTAVIQTGLNLIKAIWQPAWSAMKDWINIVWLTIRTIVKTAIDLVTGIISVGLDLLTGHWGKAWSDLKTMVSSVFGDIEKFLTGIVGDVFNLGVNIGQAIINGIVSIIESGADLVGGAIEGLIAKIPGGSTVEHFLGLGDGKSKPKPTAAPAPAPSSAGHIGPFHFAGGTSYAPGGSALVGEEGPELVNLPRGSQVIPARRTAAMIGGGGGELHVHLEGAMFVGTLPDDVADRIIDPIRRAAARRGRSVVNLGFVS